MIVFYSEELSETHALLTGDEHKHCVRVLRHKLGDTIHLMDGMGNKAIGKIKAIGKTESEIDIIEIDRKQDLPIKRAIAIAPTKNNARLEWFLEKATEIGITDVYPLIFDRSERRNIKMSRLEKIILSATKQSLRYYKPQIHELQSFPDFIKTVDVHTQQLFIAHYSEENPILKSICDSKKSALVLIGPEGDFSQEEILLSREKQFISVNLSENRLRTETAGLVALLQII